jgi:hypothetical protein
MEALSKDTFQLVFEFLVNDGLAIGRLSLCSHGLHERIEGNNAIWKQMYHARWTRSSVSTEELEEQYRQEYFRRHILDQHVSKLLFGMTNDLQRILQLKDDEDNNKVDGDPHIGQAWDHISWKTLLMYRDESTDALRLHARENHPNSSTVDQRLLGFLACRCLQNIQFGECLLDWKQLAFNYAMHGRIQSDANGTLCNLGLPDTADSGRTDGCSQAHYRTKCQQSIGRNRR